MRMKRSQRRIRRRRKRRRKRKRKKGAKLVAVLLQHARVLPSTHLREGWVVRLLRMRRKENFIDLKLQRKFHNPRMDLKVRIGQTRVDLIGRLWCQWFYIANWSFARTSDWRGQRIQGVFHGRWTYFAKLGYKEVANGISVWTCHDWYIQCGWHFEAIAFSWEVDFLWATKLRWIQMEKAGSSWRVVERLQSICAMVFGNSQSVDLGPFSKAGQVKGSVRPNGKGRLMAGEGDAEQEPEQAAEDEGFAARALPAPPQPTPEMVASHNVSPYSFQELVCTLRPR